MQNIIEETKFLMKKYNIKANKNLGQNFLINMDVINEIIDCSNITKNDLVIEIGPGLGTLTSFLLEKAGKVICIELDPKMVSILNDRFYLYDNFQVLNLDVLKTNISELISEAKKFKNIQSAKIVSNLPYYITTPIIMKLLEEKLDLESITVMIQKEVADRLTSIPGDKNCGAITYTVYYYSVAEKILEVPNTSFIPEPDVTSEVIKLNIRTSPAILVKNESFLFKVIKNSFMQRRKTLLNSLTNSKIFPSKDFGIKVLNDLNLPENIRAENLTINDFGRLSDLLYDNLDY